MFKVRNTCPGAHRRAPAVCRPCRATPLQGDGLEAPDTPDSMPVAFLGRFVYTAEAPAYLLDAFEDLVEGPETQGSLADVSSPPPAAAAAAASAAAMLVPLPLLSRLWLRSQQAALATSTSCTGRCYGAMKRPNHTASAFRQWKR